MTDDTLTADLPIGAGAAAGVVAYLLGYLVTYVWQSGSVEQRLQGFNFLADLFGSDPIPVWQGVGWLFYNAHFVRTQFEGGLGGPRSQNFISSADDGTLTLLYLAPVVLLLAAGFALARFRGADQPVDGAVVGATAIVGYLPLAVGGAFVFAYGDAVAPDLITAVLLAGAVYPLVLGAVGGAIGALIVRRT